MKLILYIILKKQKTSFNLTFRYIDVLSLNSPKFNHFMDAIYPKELEIKDTTDSPKWANYLRPSGVLMRMVHFSHDSMTSVKTLIFQ